MEYGDCIGKKQNKCGWQHKKLFLEKMNFPKETKSYEKEMHFVLHNASSWLYIHKFGNPS